MADAKDQQFRPVGVVLVQNTVLARVDPITVGQSFHWLHVLGALTGTVAFEEPINRADDLAADLGRERPYVLLGGW